MGMDEEYGEVDYRVIKHYIYYFKKEVKVK